MLTQPIGSTSYKNQRREKFCESSRRNPAKQHYRAFFGYFLPPWAKSINNASETEARKTTHKVSERQNFALTNSTPPSALRRPERTTDSQVHRCSANIASNGQAQEFFAGVLTQPIGSTSYKNQRREKFCESSRRNPAKQHYRAFFGYFLPPWAKSINNASETEARKTTHKVSERQNFALTNSTPL